MNNVFSKLKEYLFTYIVNQVKITSIDKIYYANDDFTDNEYITIDIITNSRLAMGNSYEIIDNQRKIIIDKLAKVQIKYVGENAIEKLEEIADKMTIEEEGRQFLKDNFITVNITESVIDAGKIIGDNKLEHAYFEIDVYYSTLYFDNKIPDSINNVNINYE
jgi:hypothetical protein